MTGWYSNIPDVGLAKKIDKYFRHRLLHLNIYSTAIDTINWSLQQTDIAKEKRLRVADMGCGTGWLTAYLSQLKEIEIIFAIDKDLTYFTPSSNEIKKLFPNVQLAKIKSMKESFRMACEKLKNIDMLIYCASIHHTSSLRKQLKKSIECLSENGCIIIINEDKYGRKELSALAVKSILSNLKKGKIKSTIKIVWEWMTHGYFIYDTKLGDHAYKEITLIKELERLGLKIEKKYYTNSAYKIVDGRPQLFSIMAKKV